jgi:hypothetical protein
MQKRFSRGKGGKFWYAKGATSAQGGSDYLGYETPCDVKLHISPEKTVITPIEEGFNFLGQNVRKYKTGKRYKLLIKPSKKNVKTFLNETASRRHEWGV